MDGLRLRLGWVGPLAPPPYGRSLGRLAIRKWGVGPDWVLDPRAGLVLAGTHLGGLRMETPRAMADLETADHYADICCD